MFDPIAIDCVTNATRVYSLINSVAFDPNEPLFCATFTTRNLLCLYQIRPSGRVVLTQRVEGSGMDAPQHALFSPDGRRVLVVNWLGESFTTYRRGPDGAVLADSAMVQKFPAQLASFKPHGMEYSPSGAHVVVAFGASSQHHTGLATFACEPDSHRLELTSLNEWRGWPGIPKGVCFSPDGTRVAVTLSSTDRIHLYEFDAQRGELSPTAVQEVHGPQTGMSRPEDVKLTSDGSFLLVSNSGANTVGFHPFDPTSNRVTSPVPTFVIGGPRGPLKFPHGLAVSRDGAYLAISQFGPLPTTEDEDIVFDGQTPATQARIWIHGRQGRRGAPQMHWTWASRVRDVVAPRN